MATIRIPTPLRKYTQGDEQVSAAGATVAEVLADLDHNHPGIKDRLFDDKGQVRRFVNIFVDGEDIRHLQNLDTPVPEGGQISIIPAIAGGR